MTEGEPKIEEEKLTDGIEGENDIAIRKERMKTKLYIPRNVEGKPNTEKLGIIKDVEKVLSKCPAFIGLAPFGSVVSGTNMESSDIDMFVLYDVAIPKTTDEIPTNEIREVYETLWQCVAEYRKDDVKIEALPRGIPLDAIVKDINEKHFDGDTAAYLSDMSRVVSGRKIDQYRKIISKRLQRLSDEEKEQFADIITKILTKFDEVSISKRRKRIHDFTEEDHREILEKRKEMWVKRVKKIWGIGGNK